MTKQQEFRKQTEEARFEAFALMCKKVADLEKENAELKNRNQELLESCEGATMMYKRLTKAKELLKKFIEISNPIYFEEDRQKVKVQAEQFLKENE